MNSAGEGPGRRGPRARRLSPNTKINNLRGKKKTKANFKLNIIKNQAKGVVVKVANRRGRPPIKREPATPAATPPPPAPPGDGASPPDPVAKTRGRKKNEPAEDKQNEPSETNKSTPKDSDNKKTVLKNLPKKVMKKKIIVATKGIAKKKVLLMQQIIKSDAKQVDPKVLKKNLTAKLKSVSEKLEAKKDIVEKDAQLNSESAGSVVPAVEIKKEPETLEVPSSMPGSRSSSPRTGGARKRNSADTSSSKVFLADVSALPTGIKSPYSTRSERSRSPFPPGGDRTKLLLRNGRERKSKGGLKNALLSESVGQELKKRRRLLSDPRLGDLSPDSLDELKKGKRLRSYSRDGSEISKCSDVTESDLSYCDTMSIDAENNKSIDIKDGYDEILEEAIKVESELPSVEIALTKIVELIKESEVPACGNVVRDKVGPTAEIVQSRSDSMDNENNNTDEKIKTDELFVSEKLGDAIETIDDTVSSDKTEKSFILDNMSKTFNDSKSKIRRSTRQKKSTVKAKELEEMVLSEKDALELMLVKASSSSPNESTADKSISEEETSPKSVDGDQNSTKITAKKFYGESNQGNGTLTVKAKDPSPSSHQDFLPAADSLPSSEPLDGDDVKLHFDAEDDHEDGPIDESAKENIQTGFTSESNSQDIDNLIHKLKNFEELHRNLQEERFGLADKLPLMVSSDVVLIPKINSEFKTLKETPNAIEKSEKSKENILSCFENNSAISVVIKEPLRKSLDIDLPSTVTLIKRTGTASRKHSTSSLSSKDNVDVTLELRKSIDKGILSLETTGGSAKSSTISTGNGQSISISLKPQSTVNTVKDCVTVTPSTTPANSANPVTALISRPTPSQLMITPVIPATVTAPLTSPTSITPVTSTPSPITSDIPKAQDALKLLNTQLIPESTLIVPQGSIISSSISIIPALSIVPSISLNSAVSSNSVIPVNTTLTSTTSITPALLRTSSELTITPEVSVIPTPPPSEASSGVNAAPNKKPVKKGGEPVATLASMALPLVSTQNLNKKSANISQPPVISLVESPEKQKQKEKILRMLGLLTHKEADEAKLEKLKQKELIKSNKTGVPKAAANSDGYTGTLKTVIKINRTSPDKKKSRSPLKMTFQKSKSRGSKLVSDGVSGDSESDDNPHYTIHKEYGGSTSYVGSSEQQVTASGGHRKTHYSNRFNNHDVAPSEAPGDPAAEATPPAKEDLNLVIPEKASSFAIHPGRVCQDQCYYCGGKFGLFDTPCHVAQIKSHERQKKILDNEEKLTVDSCLCDACYRHVDRRANCPGYRRRALGAGPLAAPASSDGALCHANTCRRPAPHSLRRKWLVKMRLSVSKVVQLDLDFPGLHTIPLCDVHYQAISHLMVCGLCNKGLSRNHVHYINQEYQALNPLVNALGLPVVFRERPVVCKLCRYFCTLLLRPPAPHQLNKQAFLTNYRRRLLQAHNIKIPEDSDRYTTDLASSDTGKDQSDSTKDKKKGKNGKNKTKKSSELRKSTEDKRNSENLPDSEGHKKDESNPPKSGIEEDIESLISTNTIPIPGAASKAGSHTDTIRTISEVSDNSDLDTMIEYDNPLISAMDKQTELQHLLQKCQVPSSTILQRGPTSNLTQKSRNILKVHNSPAISKTSINQKILDKNARRIQKLGQIITKPPDINKVLTDKLPNRDEFTIEAASSPAGEATGLNLLRNIVLNDECTIETLPPKNSRGIDINSLKSKLQMSDSFSTIKKNLKNLSKRLPDDFHKKKSDNRDNRFFNPVQRLETNPSISVRELFPGEEEMNLQCSIDFGNVKSITPEGWEKCSSTIQYDSDTKKLWHELQKPYGNQSSFLRHLILLEKYFRNGDLVLAHNANCNAVTYSESVQNRLRSYDNIPSNGEMLCLPSAGKTHPKYNPRAPSPPPLLPPETVLETVKRSDSSSLIEFRRQKTGNITGKSLLKTNQSGDHSKSLPHKNSSSIARPLDGFLPPSVNHAKIPRNVPISIAQINQTVDQGFNASKIPKNVPLSLQQLEKLSNQISSPAHASTPPRPPTPRPPSLPPAVPLETRTTTPKTDSAQSKPKTPSLPPELIALNPQRKSIENVLKNIQQLAKGSSTPVRHTTPPPPLQTPGISPINSAKPEEVLPVPPAAPVTTNKSKSSSKNWRPTLIPITDESKARNPRDTLYQTADGRRLPSLVQVMSGGKPYHITIQDYNKMCVMRREKLQQMHKAENTKNKSPSPTTSLMHGISYDPSQDTPVATTSPTPVTVLPDNSNVQSMTNNKSADQVSPTPPKPSQNKVEAGAECSAEASLLKSAGLKGVSSLLVALPPIMAQLGSAISVTAEPALPKLPKSLTVIPQPAPKP